MSRRHPSAAIVPPTVANSHESGDDAHPPGGDDRADEDPQPERQGAVAVALQAHEAVADQSAGDTAETDRRKRGRPGCW
jgi:hypothetical protein